MKEQTIIIVGAGISGLIAAWELADHYKVIVLEASRRTGGRIFSYQGNNFEGIIEGGAEFIHGPLKHTMKLLEEAGIKYVPVKGNMYRRKNNKWQKQDDRIEGWDELLGKMKELKTDTTLDEFLLQYFEGEKYRELRHQAIAYAEGFDVADVKKASVQSLYREWSGETEKSYRIPGGYGSLVNFIEDQCRNKGCTIICGDAVKQIDWKPGAVTVSTSGSQKFEGHKVIVTVPVSILDIVRAKSAIHFTPTLDEYMRASKEIGFGGVIKVVLQFRQAFWKDDTGFIFSDEIIPTWWTQLPDPVPVLTGWVGGTKAGLLSNETDEELLEKALLSLAAIFHLDAGKIRDGLLATKVFNWEKEEYALGAYSYSMPGSPQARQLLNTPVENTVFFSGEGLYDGKLPGTVEAAIIQAKETVKNILKVHSRL